MFFFNEISKIKTSGYQDPFTGGGRYIPGGGGGVSNNSNNVANMVDPFTGASSYRSVQAQAESLNSTNTSARSTIPTGIRHFPYSQFVTFDVCDAAKVLNKLK